jgi:predicted nucleic acid-binding protein
MMLLDTSALIELLKGNPVITSAVRESESKGDDVAFSSVSLFELLQSVYHRKQPQQERKIKAMAAQAFVLPLDVRAAEESAKIMGSLLRVGRPVNALDVLIAGTAAANGASVLVTSDRDFLEIEKVSDLKIQFLR